MSVADGKDEERGEVPSPVTVDDEQRGIPSLVPVDGEQSGIPPPVQEDEEQRGTPSPVQEAEEQGEVPDDNNDSGTPVIVEEALATSGTVATNELPVASMVVPSDPPPELVERMHSLEDQENRRVNATPVDAEELRKMQARKRRWILGGSIVVVLAIVAVVLGVTLGGNKSSPSPSAVKINTSPTPVPTTQAYVALQDLMSSVTLDGGAAFADPLSPQSKALAWLEGNANLDDYPDWRMIQRYTLATFYYCTNGDGWLESDGWLTDDDECAWFSSAVDPVCDENGAFGRLVLFYNNVTGILPKELGLLSDSMRKCD